jgi:hypothetical protein
MNKAGNVPPGPVLKGGRKTRNVRKNRKTRKVRKH